MVDRWWLWWPVGVCDGQLVVVMVARWWLWWWPGSGCGGQVVVAMVATWCLMVVRWWL